MDRKIRLRAVALIALAGCGYTTRPMYPYSIHTVYVPMFQSLDFRRDWEFQLTEAVIKQIEKTTPYKIVRSEDADTVLRGTIHGVRKRVLVHTPEDESRQLETAVVLEVQWRDLRSGELLGSEHIEPIPQSLLVRQTAEFAPELGQSMATSRQQVIDKLAVQVVSMMEEPW